MNKNDAISLIKAEIKWCEEHKQPDEKGHEWFIKGLKQAILLIEKL